MRKQIGLCNVVTGEHSAAFRSPGKEPRPEITIPSHRARLSIDEAKALAADLNKAAVIAGLESGVDPRAEYISRLAEIAQAEGFCWTVKALAEVAKAAANMNPRLAAQYSRIGELLESVGNTSDFAPDI